MAADCVRAYVLSRPRTSCHNTTVNKPKNNAKTNPKTGKKNKADLREESSLDNRVIAVAAEMAALVVVDFRVQVHFLVRHRQGVLAVGHWA